MLEEAVLILRLMVDAWVGGSTAGMNVNDYYSFVEKARAWAGQFLGLVIPDPDVDWKKK